MRNGSQWLATAVAASALALSGGTATAQGAPPLADVRREADLRPPTIVTLVPFAGSRDRDTMARFGMPVVNSLYREGGIFAYRHDPSDPRCLWDRHEPVCVAQEDILQEANSSRRDALRQGLHDNSGLYRTARIMRRAVHELTIPTTSNDRRDALHAEVLTAVQSDPIVLRAACERRSINDCLLPLQETATTEHFARNLEELAERLEDARANVACEFACETAGDNQFCQRHHLGRLATVGWDHAPNHTDGGMSLCTASDRDPNCQRRPVIALGRYTCESLRSFWSLVGVQAQARRDRAEAAEQQFRLAVATEQREEHLLPGLLAAHNAAPTSNDRDGDTIADTVDQCPDTAQGEHTDPHRVGCPAPEIETEVAPRRHVRRQRAPRARAAEAPRPAPPVLDQENTGNGMMCSAPEARGQLFTRVCETRDRFEERVLRQTPHLAPGPDTMPGLDNLAPRLQRYRRQIERMLVANPGTRGTCSSPIIFACRKTSWTRRNPAHFVQRIGVCNDRNGPATDTVTLASFIEDAATECGADPEVTIMVAPGHRLRLWFDQMPTDGASPQIEEDSNELPVTTQLTPSPRGTAESGALVTIAAFDNNSFTAIDDTANATATTNPASTTMNPGTARVLLASRDFVRRLTASPLARTFPQSHPNVRYAEVTARSGTTTRGDKVSALGPPRRCPAGMRCWWHPPLSAIA